MKYFKLSEFFDSRTALLKGIDNRPPANEEAEILANIEALAVNVLDPAREAFGSPIIISSGYRCKELNKAVGGSKTSQHMRGEASDLKSPNNLKLFNILKGFEFDQLIWEKGGAWVHVSYKRNGKNRKQILYK